MNCRVKSACHKIWGVLVVVIAVVLGLIVTMAAARVGLMNIAALVRFLQFILIVLGVGALIKYLFTCSPCPCVCGKREGIGRIEG